MSEAKEGEALEAVAMDLESGGAAFQIPNAKLTLLESASRESSWRLSQARGKRH